MSTRYVVSIRVDLTAEEADALGHYARQLEASAPDAVTAFKSGHLTNRAALHALIRLRLAEVAPNTPAARAA
jgi:hypothetical protein